MAGEIISRIIKAIEKRVEENGSSIVVNGMNHEIKKERFNPITDLAREKTVFVDGGNAELLSAPNFSLQFVRVIAVVHENNKRVKTEKSEFYVLAAAKKHGRGIVYDIKIFGENASFNDIDSEDSTLMQGKHKASASNAVELCRRLEEIRIARKMAGEGSIIVIDGSLDAAKTGEKEELDMLFRKAKEKNATVCGLSKTTRLTTETGSSAAAAVSAIAPKGEWVYSVCDGVHLAKLHRNSSHVFRVDISDDNIANASSALKQNSKDPVFLGYPYGLIEADRLARISNNEAEYLRMMFAAKGGKNFEKIKSHLNALNAHSILDSIS